MKKNIYLILLCLGLTSCFEDGFDLGNLNTTIGTNIDLTLPKSSAGDILLKNIMQLEDDGVIKLVSTGNDGERMYVVSESGNTSAKVTIDPIKIKTPKVNDLDATLLLASFNGEKKTRKNARRKAEEKSITVSLPGGYSINIPLSFNFSYHFKGNTNMQQMQNVESGMISDDLLELSRVNCQQIEVISSFKVGGLPDWAPNIIIDNMALKFPKGLDVDKCTICGVNAKDMSKMREGEILLTDGGGNVFSHDIELRMQFSSADISENNDLSFSGATHKVSFMGMFQAEGDFRVSESEVDTKKLEAAINSHITNGMNDSERQTLALALRSGDSNKVKIAINEIIHGLLPDKINYKGTTKFSDDEIQITKITGVVEHEVKVDPIEIKNLPDFLNDPEVSLDLDNPALLLKLRSDLGQTVSTSINLTANYKNDPEKKVQCSVENISIQGNGNNQYYYLSQYKSDKDEHYIRFPQGEGSEAYEPFKDAEHIEAKNLAALIEHIPDYIDINIAPVRLECNDFDITKSYEVDVDYEMYSPLTFGPNFRLVYQDTESDLNIGDDMDNIEFDSDAVIELTANVTSTLPAAVTFTMELRDAQQNSLNHIVDAVSVTIPAHAGQNKKHPIAIQVKAQEGHNIGEILHSGKNQMDGIHYKAKITDADKESPLLENSGIKLDDIQIRVKSKVVVKN